MLLPIALLLCLLHHSVLGNSQYPHSSSDYFYSPYSSAYPSSSLSSSYPNYLYHHRPYGGYGTSSSSSYYRPGNGYGTGSVYPGGGGYGTSLPLTSGYGPNSGYGTGPYGGGSFPPVRPTDDCSNAYGQLIPALGVPPASPYYGVSGTPFGGPGRPSSVGGFGPSGGGFGGQPVPPPLPGQDYPSPLLYKFNPYSPQHQQQQQHRFGQAENDDGVSKRQKRLKKNSEVRRLNRRRLRRAPISEDDEPQGLSLRLPLMSIAMPEMPRRLLDKCAVERNPDEQTYFMALQFNC